MIKGIGVDILEISRIERILSQRRAPFCRKVFTEKEILYCSSYAYPASSFAGRFAAKEAIAKALGTGIGKQLRWLEMEILPDAAGKPQIFFSKEAEKRWHRPEVFLSISHCKEYATATAIWVETSI